VQQGEAIHALILAVRHVFWLLFPPMRSWHNAAPGHLTKNPFKFQSPRWSYLFHTSVIRFLEIHNWRGELIYGANIKIKLLRWDMCSLVPEYPALAQLLLKRYESGFHYLKVSPVLSHQMRTDHCIIEYLEHSNRYIAAVTSTDTDRSSYG